MCTSLSQDGFWGRDLWVGWHHYGWDPFPFLTSKEPFSACVVREVSLTSRMRNVWPFIFYLGRVQPPPWSCCYGVSVHGGETIQPGARLSPAACPGGCGGKNKHKLWGLKIWVWILTLTPLTLATPLPTGHSSVQFPYLCILNRFSGVWLFMALWAVAGQAPLSMRFSRQEFWSGLPCPPPGDLPNPGIELT